MDIGTPEVSGKENRRCIVVSARKRGLSCRHSRTGSSFLFLPAKILFHYFPFTSSIYPPTLSSVHNFYFSGLYSDEIAWLRVSLHLVTVIPPTSVSIGVRHLYLIPRILDDAKHVNWSVQTNALMPKIIASRVIPGFKQEPWTILACATLQSIAY
ncbi:hypothetical protein ARMGADRAFT_119102 [Armillaria gallica]|uniref:Uncharacterized protein n=1 Tax=Armillaria gallica TaxID=47427 RepID=A0A2H3C977_ARMGA|nr:hypothetical protein ARMGADRAFT_119102 [Armillaria gallica]